MLALGQIPVCDDFPASFHAALGRLFVAFGRVEYLVKLTVKSLSGSGFTRGMTIADSQGAFRRLCKKGKDLAKAKLSAQQFKSYCDLLDRAEKLAIERNDNVHCLWTTAQGAPVRYRPFCNNCLKTLEWRNRMVSPADLEQLAAEMEKLVAAIDSERRNWTL
jgi:hypothetical protein